MKKQELVQIFFEHSKVSYSAWVYKYATTAVILPNRTVMITNCVIHTSGPRRSEKKEHVRQIFDHEGNLIPMDVLHRPGDWVAPLNVRFPIVFAEIN